MKKNEIPLGNITSEKDLPIYNKLDSYLALIKEHDVKEIPYKRLTFITYLISNYLEDKIVTKDFIELEEPYYFNMKELLTSGTVKAYTKQPLEDRIETYEIKLVPNNLDSFDSNLTFYHYGNKASLHRGVYIFNDSVPIPLIFDYDLEVKEITIVYVPNPLNLIDYAEKDEDYIIINNILESIENSDNTNLDDKFKVIENIGRLNRVILNYKLGKFEGLDNIKELISNSDKVKASEINNPVKVLINENEEKDKQINEIKSEVSRIKNIIEDVENTEYTKEDLLKYHEEKPEEK